MSNSSPDFKLRLFNRWASSYDWLFPSVFYQAIHQRLLEFVHLPDRPYVLDLGCGTGRLLDRLAATFPELRGIGIDYSPEMIHQAKQRDRYSERITYLQGRAESLPVPDQQFDAVFNTVSFLHYSSPESVLAEVSRVLSPGGYFYLADFCSRWATQPQQWGVAPGRIRLYSPVVREALGQAAGLGSMGHHYLLGPVVLSVFSKPDIEITGT
ncbi:class I SAM-dependent methyltransferase [Egbenema bharatensis]|uniref:class I SAM-dependent methyltransferase n=1 Tax=Egbenema bharatensis TaxID=3463334 RepID=UPI003A8530B1